MKTQLVIFGITGDLAGRKLLPALQSIIDTGEYDDLSIVGVSRREVDLGDLLKNQPSLQERTSIFTMDLAEATDYVKLKDSLEANGSEQTLFYLSVPPGAAAGIVDFLGEAGLNTPKYKILFEKPFGFDLASAKDFIERTGRYFTEEQLFRIDHYMAKEISAELLRLRNNAENHHHHWSSELVKAITVVATESIGIEGRVQFYEQTGALRDFVQGHLMQLLSLVLMQPSAPGDLPARRLKALEQLIPVNPELALRAQYEGYQEEVQNIGSQTETLVAFSIESSDPVWSGVNMRIATGKSLSQKRSYVQIDYRDGTKDVFDEASLLEREDGSLDAYERVLLEAIAGRKDIFTSSEEVLESWKILTPLQDEWSMEHEEMPRYPVGSDLFGILGN